MTTKISYSKKLYFKAQFKLWGMLAIIITVFILDVIYGISRTSPTFKTVETLTIFYLGFAFYPVFAKGLRKMDKVEDKLIKESNAAKLGDDGEKAVAAWLDELLPKKSYTILKNVTIPGHKLDIDFVIIGPKGVIVFEVKNFTNQVSFSDDEYFQMINGKKQVLPFDQDPRTQIKRHVNLLRKHFEDRGFFNLVISKAIVFAKDNSANLSGKPGVYIINGQDSLVNYINRMNEFPEYKNEFCQKIIRCLESKQ